MNKINMAELLADREKGTEGPWRVRENARHNPVECDLTICGDIWQLADINGPQYEHQEANAQRIARLPDLEAAYIEAVEALRRILNAETYALHVGYDSAPGGGNFVYADAIRTDDEAFIHARATLEKLNV